MFLCSGKEFVKDLKEDETQSYAVVLKSKGEEKIVKESLLVEVKALLLKYKYIVSDGTPTTLPPRRVISYQIVFVPSASFPNKAAYKLTLDKNMEVAWQVQELLDQGLN